MGKTVSDDGTHEVRRSIHLMANIIDKDRGWKRLMKMLKKVPYAKVGILASGEAGTDHGGMTNVAIGAIHEFGAPSRGIPQRSWLVSTFKKKEKELEAFTKGLVKQIYDVKLTVNKATALLGEWGAAQVRANIATGPHLKPKLADATKAAKGSSRPLVHEGQLVGSITYEVKEG